LVRANHADHVVGLIDGAEQRAANGRIVEGRGELVEAQRGDEAGGNDVFHLQIVLLLQLRQLVGIWRQPPVDLAGLQRAGDGGRVGNDVPLDAVDVGDLRSGCAAGSAVGAWNVFGIAFVDDQRTGDAFAGYVFVWTAADHFGD